MAGNFRRFTTRLVLHVFPDGSSLSAQTYSSLADVKKFITLKPVTLSRRAINRWKDQKVFYNSCIWILVRFPSEKSHICTY
jgi:hypothetical protein